MRHQSPYSPRLLYEVPLDDYKSHVSTDRITEQILFKNRINSE